MMLWSITTCVCDLVQNLRITRTTEAKRLGLEPSSSSTLQRSRNLQAPAARSTHLELLLATGGDVGNGPAGLLANTLAVAIEQREEIRQHIAIDDKLCLIVISSDNVANRPQSRSLDLCHTSSRKTRQCRTHGGETLLRQVVSAGVACCLCNSATGGCQADKEMMHKGRVVGWQIRQDSTVQDVLESQPEGKGA